MIHDGVFLLCYYGKVKHLMIRMGYVNGHSGKNMCGSGVLQVLNLILHPNWSCQEFCMLRKGLQPI